MNGFISNVSYLIFYSVTKEARKRINFRIPRKYFESTVDLLYILDKIGISLVWLEGEQQCRILCMGCLM